MMGTSSEEFREVTMTTKSSRYFFRWTKRGDFDILSR